MGLLDDTTQQQYYNNDNDFGNYQFTSLDDIITQFQIVYVGEGKIIPKVKRVDIAFHAQRALAELSFDTLKSVKAQEITVPATLQMALPQDYVNYTKVSWVDSAGIKHLMYPTSKTSNPQRHQIDSDNEYLFDSQGNRILSGNLLKNGNFHGTSEPWILNSSGTGTPANQTTTTTSNALGILEPEIGWFYGFDGNAIGGYNLNQWQGFRQENIPIIPGEKYTITYTISNYTFGSFQFIIGNSLGGVTGGTNRSADGTYEETVTASTTGNTSVAYVKNQLWIRNTVDTADEVSVTIDNISIVRVGDENPNTIWENYKSGTPSENQNQYDDDTYWPMDGSRFGLDPQHAQANGSFYIDNISGKIHFSSNISGKTVILDYISDSLGTDAEMQVHKFAEEAMYKWITHAILSASSYGQPLVPRLTKEKFAAIRKAKLRLSNIKLEELTQILRGKSKQIKH